MTAGFILPGETNVKNVIDNNAIKLNMQTLTFKQYFNMSN